MRAACAANTEGASMAVTLEYTLARAEECAAAAASCDLEMVRDRYLRSAKAWQDMADRMVRTEALRRRSAGDFAIDN